ncbi:MAG: mechanosensitive ion channel family protein, partial [Syntrophomonas sp.]
MNNLNLKMIAAYLQSIQPILVALLIFLIFIILRKVFTKYIFTWTMALLDKGRVHWDTKILLAFEKPLRALIVITGLYLALKYLPMNVYQDQTVVRFFRSALAVLFCWGFYELAGAESLLSREFKEKLQIDNILLPFFSKVLRFIIITLAVVAVAREWNYDVNGFIAGLGLGGLAFALAAKDALANIFGGIVIILEKPFMIGDSISIPGVEGTVEDISFRSTRIRAANQALITVPNSTLANQAIANSSRLTRRRIKFSLRVAANTPKSKLESCIESIKEMIAGLPDINPESVALQFESLSENGIDIVIDCFTLTGSSESYNEMKTTINYRILDILEQEGVQTATPA